jgi:hypothetical protein
LWAKKNQLGEIMIETIEEIRTEFASTRSHDASKASYDLCKTIAQACLLINGGAATAVIALLSKDRVDVALLTYIPWGLTAYAFGVVVSAFMLYCVMMTAENWNFFWYHSVHDIDQERAKDSEDEGEEWQTRMNRAFVFATGCFFIGSAIVAFGMSRVAPTPSIWPMVVLATPAAPDTKTH